MEQRKLDRIIGINQKYRFNHYLELNRELGKCVVMITDRQMFFAPSVKILDKDHWALTCALLESIGVNIEDESNVQAIFLSAVRNEITIDLPRNISPTQIVLMN